MKRATNATMTDLRSVEATQSLPLQHNHVINEMIVKRMFLTMHKTLDKIVIRRTAWTELNCTGWLWELGNFDFRSRSLNFRDQATACAVSMDISSTSSSRVYLMSLRLFSLQMSLWLCRQSYLCVSLYQPTCWTATVPKPCVRTLHQTNPFVSNSNKSDGTKMQLAGMQSLIDVPSIPIGLAESCYL